MDLVLLVVILLVLVITILLVLEIRRKNIHIWIRDYLTRKQEKFVEGEPVHIIFAFCDHFEPQWGKASYQQEVERVARWCSEYPQLVERHRDAAGNPPKHTFFYPQEEYRKEHLDSLVDLCKQGCGEIEIHLHHDNDTAEGLTDKLNVFLKQLKEDHEAVPVDETGKYQFAFIHGNWALDNSRKDGRWCGVKNELALLSRLGCYADFTLPSAPSDTQTSKVNSIYYAKGRDGMSKSHDQGIDVEVGKPASGDLMIIQGPLCLNWKNRKFGIFPRIENSDIRSSSPPSEDRVDLWVRCGIRVKKQPQWLFIKVHTHGTQEGDIETILGDPVDSMFEYLEHKYNDGQKYVLHYVSAREMYNLAVAAEAGMQGDPDNYRDYSVGRPAYLQESKT